MKTIWVLSEQTYPQSGGKFEEIKGVFASEKAAEAFKAGAVAIEQAQGRLISDAKDWEIEEWKVATDAD